MPVSKPFFSAVSISAAEVPERLISSMKVASFGLFSATFLASGWSAAIAMNEAPKIVSGRVV